MKTIKARIPVGVTTTIQTVELYTKDEAKKLLVGKEWEIGIDIYSPVKPTERIGWLASFPNGEGIYVEAK